MKYKRFLVDLKQEEYNKLKEILNKYEITQSQFLRFYISRLTGEYFEVDIRSLYNFLHKDFNTKRREIANKEWEEKVKKAEEFWKERVFLT